MKISIDYQRVAEKVELRSSSHQKLIHLEVKMNLFLLLNFVFRQVVLGQIIGSPTLPILDNGDVSGMTFEMTC